MQSNVNFYKILQNFPNISFFYFQYFYIIENICTIMQTTIDQGRKANIVFVSDEIMAKFVR